MEITVPVKPWRIQDHPKVAGSAVGAVVLGVGLIALGCVGRSFGLKADGLLLGGGAIALTAAVGGVLLCRHLNRPIAKRSLDDLKINGHPWRDVQEGQMLNMHDPRAISAEAKRQWGEEKSGTKHIYHLSCGRSDFTASIDQSGSDPELKLFCWALHQKSAATNEHLDRLINDFLYSDRPIAVICKDWEAAQMLKARLEEATKRR